MPDSNPSSTPLPAVFQVRIAPDGWVFAATPAQSVLQAGLAAGVELESSCRNGTCRTCLCRLVQGEVAYAIDWPGVSADEKAEGWFLPCVAQARSDLVVEQPMAWSTAP
ncbi:2Fe-2S iron-sulfur cluster-binding protein [Rhodoferax sp. TS-BS-61-7]|uniref:2Fe-2S iron-sulfur cluster-binding protein n=1 Tax=Rhodoferax sp. TS-BS-61-7 TaxID=2094194 RepID=UPI000CF63B73|nr:2Fe-2S iron-sulfur cluster-binding protein [Rhodoferax sp. TS-BS-61-7]PQA79193.1 ferredoxin [Rhodoferax sp. TS-BS-61-7]